MVTQRQVFAYSGMIEGTGQPLGNADLARFALSLTGKDSGQNVCYVPTAVGDSPVATRAKSEEFAREHPQVRLSMLTLFTQPNVEDIRGHLLSQDLILVEGGSVANLMAVWRVHGLPEILLECWEAGVVLAGASAGSICWHTGGPTDSFGDELAAFTDGLGLLPFSNGVHDDFPDQPRRRIYRELVGSGALSAGYATEDGVGLHYVGTKLHEAVTIKDRANAWWVEPGRDGNYSEVAVPTRPL